MSGVIVAQPIETIAQLFYRAAEFNLPDALAVKRDGVYEPISHTELVARVERLALAMSSHGLKTGDRVAILSENRPEWAILDLACALQGLPDVTIYATLNPAQAAFILKDSASRWVICSDRAQLEKVLSHWDRLPCLEAAVLIDGDLPEGTGRNLLRWSTPRGPYSPTATWSPTSWPHSRLWRWDRATAA
jgi:long-chain acyl-CoA synthetase